MGIERRAKSDIKGATTFAAATILSGALEFATELSDTVSDRIDKRARQAAAHGGSRAGEKIFKDTSLRKIEDGT